MDQRGWVVAAIEKVEQMTNDRTPVIYRDIRGEGGEPPAGGRGAQPGDIFFDGDGCYFKLSDDLKWEPAAGRAGLRELVDRIFPAPDEEPQDV